MPDQHSQRENLTSQSAHEVFALQSRSEGGSEEGQVEKVEIIPKLHVVYYYNISICCVIVPAKLMRLPRVKANGQGFYHCVSRLVEGRFILQISGHGSVEAERFIEIQHFVKTVALYGYWLAHS